MPTWPSSLTWIGQHDLQSVGHHLSRGAAADVEEVSRPDPAEGLARVGDDVQRGHHQASPVADNADLALELNVVKVLGLGARLQRIAAAWIFEPAEVLPEGGVIVEGHLGVQRDYR